MELHFCSGLSLCHKIYHYVTKLILSLLMASKNSGIPLLALRHFTTTPLGFKAPPPCGVTK